MIWFLQTILVKTKNCDAGEGCYVKWMYIQQNWYNHQTCWTLLRKFLLWQQPGSVDARAEENFLNGKELQKRVTLWIKEPIYITIHCFEHNINQFICLLAIQRKLPSDVLGSSFKNIERKGIIFCILIVIVIQKAVHNSKGKYCDSRFLIFT